jgi:nitroimidazol reductase NimA-like FMN-containing flavoprotein (pyridoxamine 5'-phosphate oxidase superfamily)
MERRGSTGICCGIYSVKRNRDRITFHKEDIMRREEREIKDRETLESIIMRAKVCRLALSGNDHPYVVPLNFGFRDNCLYFHSAGEGRKIDMIRENSNVCFELDVDAELIEAESACEWGMRYQSVIGFGRASLLDDHDEKRRALSIIMEHYSVGSQFEYHPKLIDSVVIIKVPIESMTGKGYR